MEKTEIKENNRSFLVGAVYGTVMGVLGGIGVGPLSIDNINRLQTGQTDNKVSVIRVHRKGLDKICIEDPNNQGSYLPMDEYLETISKTADRKIQEAEIRKAAHWYD